MTSVIKTRNGRNHIPYDRNSSDSNSGSNNEEDHLAPPPPDVNSWTTVDEIHVVLTYLTTQDAHTDSKLYTLLLKESELEYSLACPQLLRAHLGRQVVAASKETLEVVADVAKLITSDLVVTGSMGEPQNWENALTDIKSYRFSFLVQSSMSSIRGCKGVSSHSGSPVPGGAAHKNSEDESVDIKDVDILLSEVVVILG
ncbi:hypothetical protein B9Z19DRAFT_1121712 [Tuber borchii]|uniref:Uncharacterized protein n=1 Tax=Tuber borchii TaxID=42251 RepID=A0A2T7A238_TUBBO|nr:hypothetical protein B9Z19DRAFT_1121712 [Tuber borchii]